MKYILKSIFLLQVIIEMAMNSAMTFERLLMILLIIGINVYKERFYNSKYLVIVEFVFITVGIIFDMPLEILYGLILYDLVYDKAYIWILPVLASIIYFKMWKAYSLLPLIIVMAVLFAYITNKMEKQSENSQRILDNERRLRYSLEKAQVQLLKSQEEIAHITEIKERNRIAREIHDNIGHSVAGILIQLQVAFKIFSKDEEKTKGIIKKSIDKLSETLIMLRDTVHNIKPSEKMGLEYIHAIIDDFRFCKIEFQHSGDFEILSPRYMVVITKTIKEALTNIVKHSKASKVVIQLDVNEKLVRLYIKDNGIGCSRIKEGLGFSGMKERINNLGGSISISSKNGLMIVCVLYNEKEVVS